MRRQAVLTLLLASMTTVLCAARCGGDDKDKGEDSATSGDAPVSEEQMNLNDPMPSGEPDTSGLVDPSDATPGGSVDQVPAEDLDAQPAEPEPSSDL